MSAIDDDEAGFDRDVPTLKTPPPLAEAQAPDKAPVQDQADAQRPRPRSGVDLRLHERKPFQVAVQFVSEHNFYTGLSRDISQGGLFIATSKLLPVGTRIDLDFNLAGGQSFRCEAEVRWTTNPAASDDLDSPPGMGVRFVALPPDADAAIADFVRLRDPILYEER